MKQKKKKIPQPPTEAFDERFARIVQMTQDICKKRGDLQGQAIAYDSYDHQHMLVNAVDHHDHAEIFANTLRRYFLKNKICEYYFIATGWTVCIDLHRQMEMNRTMAMGQRRELHLHPEKREALFIVGVRGELKRFVVYFINRDTEEQVIGYEFQQELREPRGEGQRIEGRFADLLDTLPGH